MSVELLMLIATMDTTMIGHSYKKIVRATGRTFNVTKAIWRFLITIAYGQASCLLLDIHQLADRARHICEQKDIVEFLETHVRVAWKIGMPLRRHLVQ